MPLLGGASQSGKQIVVIRMRAYPEPDHSIIAPDTHRSPTDTYPYRVDRLPRVDPLEL